MFKSVFSKYVTAFMLIILVSFLVVLVITATSIGRFSNDVKKEVVKNTVETSKIYFSSLLYSSGASELSVLDEREHTEAERMLNNVAFNVEDVSTVVTDLKGNIVFSYFCENSEMKFEGAPSEELLAALTVDEIYFSDGEFTGLFEGANVLCGTVIENGNGEECGYVFSCSDSFMMSDLWELMFKIVMGAILW